MPCACVSTGLQAHGQRPLRGGPASGAPAPTAPWAAGGLVRDCALVLRGGAQARAQMSTHTPSWACTHSRTHPRWTSQATVRVPVCGSPPCHLTIPQAGSCPGDVHKRPPHPAPLEGSQCPCKLGFCSSKMAPPTGGPTLARGWQESPRLGQAESGEGIRASAPLSPSPPPGPPAACHLTLAVPALQTHFLETPPQNIPMFSAVKLFCCWGGIDPHRSPEGLGRSPWGV